jgi:hypothetical protein
VIVVHAQLPGVDHGTPSRECEAVSLTELVEAALNVDNLRMEEAGRRELLIFLRALEISIQQVKVALAARWRLTSSLRTGSEKPLALMCTIRTLITTWRG